jgi:hypothetical protein
MTDAGLPMPALDLQMLMTTYGNDVTNVNFYPFNNITANKT